ncbi:MAG: siroheme synthase [Candidatus Omnitrophica bacterium CG11_big_fil_rev_8_21_14_0_20_42_13]|uniref:precorrin-2 dehydrogenase n=1 Tax=Candidatus Ghiorseimicrobium undicola TaxID=1974746 RepID=A0A2H0M1A0_9BACT|nr:MAG: siroheme synthase [Candidatus Omnitrophica bacterium CG11_big_fil_rev_8_21_14_0_20_42_13]
MPGYYPVNLNLKAKKCVVVGGGDVALRKVRRLISCGAKVEVISPKFAPHFKKAAVHGRAVLKKKHVNICDINDAFLVIAATGDRRINNLISSYCMEKGTLVNVVDCPDDCNFILPSIVEKGDLTISISTSGVSPALSKKIRVELEKKFGSEYAEFLRLMKKIRPRVISLVNKPAARKAFFKKVASSQALTLIKKHKRKQLEKKIARMLKDIPRIPR